MGSLFSYDSPLMTFLTKIADLIIVNILAFICCLPIFTIGASMTALYYVVLKMVRNEECYITKAFFKSFKENFKQATIIWLIMLFVIIVIVADILVMFFSGISFPGWLVIGVAIVLILLSIAVVHVFPVLARFENTVKGTYRNSFFMGFLAFPRSIAMLVCWLVPAFILWKLWQLAPLVIFFGFSGPAYLCAIFYNPTFKRFEPKTEEKDADEWYIEPVEEETEDAGETAEAAAEEKPKAAAEEIANEAAAAAEEAETAKEEA